MKKLIILLFLYLCATAQAYTGMKPILGEQVDWSHLLAPKAGLWFFNEGSGDTVFDLSGMSNPVLEYAREGDAIRVRYREFVAAQVEPFHWESVPKATCLGEIVDIVGVGVCAIDCEYEPEIHRFDFPFDSDDFEAACQEAAMETGSECEEIF